jgi:hypothetical protein
LSVDNHELPSHIIALGSAERLEQSLLLIGHVVHFVVVILPSVGRGRMHRDPR